MVGNKIADFRRPTQLPQPYETGAWQDANRAWWESAPMRYDWNEAIAFEPGTEAYFREVDRRFLSSARKYLPWKSIPFEQLIPFSDLRDKDVLEIGVGQGTHAQLIAPHAKSFTGIDLTAAASDMTRRRFELLNLPGRILQMDAEAMNFEKRSFDFIWSWGVIHHSADTWKVLCEMSRVLRPGGRATVMVYHRSLWHYYLLGVLRGVAAKGWRGFHRLAQEGTDGAIARFYTPREWRKLAGGNFKIERIRIYGLKVEVLPLPAGRMKTALENAIPDALARAWTHGLRQGSFLVAEMRAL